MPKVRKEIPPKLPIDIKGIGNRIATYRKNMGLTQAELAHQIGISRKLITDYETGKSHLNDEMLARFSLSLGISTDVLLGLAEAKELKDKSLPLRYTRRMKEIDKLPETKKKAILQTLDDLIKANS